MPLINREGVFSDELKSGDLLNERYPTVNR